MPQVPHHNPDWDGEPTAADEPLRQRIGDALRRSVPEPSEALEADVRAHLLQAGSSESFAGSLPDIGAARQGRWRRHAITLAAAAAVVLAILLFRITGERIALSADSPISADVAAQLFDVHKLCRKLGAHGQTARGIDIGAAPAQPAQRDESGHAAQQRMRIPDLSLLGYELIGAKPCGYPDDWTSHALYRQASGRSLSLFVQPDRGESVLIAGRLYAVTIPGSRPAIYAWKDEGRICFVVADEFEAGSKAAEAMSKPGSTGSRGRAAP